MSPPAEPEEKECSTGKSSLQMIRGLLFPTHFKKEILEEVFDFMPRDDDVIIATFPKTGTTWMQYIVIQILTKGESFPTFQDMLESVVPFLELSGVSTVEELKTKPRVYKHHFPLNVLKRNPRAKIIYVYRKPEDVLVSGYHFRRSRYASLDFDQYFEHFLTGNVSYGRYFEHVLSYLKYKDDTNMLLVSYEKLKMQTKVEILRIAKFLGEQYYNDIIGDESVLNKIIEQTSFDYMKNNLTLTIPKDPEKDHFSKDVPRKEIEFFRKGTIGDGKKSLKESQLQRLRKLAEETMKGTDILMEWLRE